MGIRVAAFVVGIAVLWLFMWGWFGRALRRTRPGRTTHLIRDIRIANCVGFAGSVLWFFACLGDTVLGSGFPNPSTWEQFWAIVGRDGRILWPIGLAFLALLTYVIHPQMSSSD
jgi:hypothetical protein